MTVPPDDATENLHATIATLRRQLDERTAELAARDSAYGERMAHQSAASDVLRAMAASPGDAQPVFDLIVERARACCGAELAALSLIDGDLLRLSATSGMTAARTQEFAAAYPHPVSQALAGGRAILMRDTVQVPDTQVDPGFAQRGTNAWHRSVLAVPLLRAAKSIGAIGLGRSTPGAFSAAQVGLLKTFAEQAVIAIGSAETYRALQTRTRDLQESLEHQTATSNVLKVISRTTFDLQPVLDMMGETAARLCIAEQAVVWRAESGMFRIVGNYGFPPAFEAYWKQRGSVSTDHNTQGVLYRAYAERRTVHVHDAAEVPGYPEPAIRLGHQRTSLGVPLLREGEPIGVLVLARQRVEPFTDRQIELVSTFADQAVIAIENARLITEQREALEQQTATAEVLKVINASPGNLAPVFDEVLEKAVRLCESAFGILITYDGEAFHGVAMHGVTPALAEFLRAPVRPRPGGTLERVVRGEDIVHVADITDDDFYRAGNSPRRALADLGGARTQLLVALRADEKLLGAFHIFRLEVRPFTGNEIALLKNFAAQAVIAMENARLITEQREALEQQTATAEVLQVINTSPGNLAPVFEVILEKAMRLCEATFSALVTDDGEMTTVGASRGLPAAFARYLATATDQPGPSGGHARLRRGAAIVHIPDLMEEDAYRSGVDPYRKALVDLGGARTFVAVALRKDVRLLGSINIYRQEVRPFTDKQIALLENFAAQAVIAMENARLLTEQREALEQQTATAEVLQVINTNPGNLAPVFDAMLEKAMRLCGAAFGSLYTYDGEHFRSAAQRGVPAAYAAHRVNNPPVSQFGIPAQILRTRRFVHVVDVMQEETYRAGEGDVRAMVELAGARTILSVPLPKDDAVLGFITIYRQEVLAFSDKQIALLENFAAQAVIAMENARLITEQREALEQQTATAEVLQVINASPGDLVPVFDSVLEKAMRLCQSEFGLFNSYDGECFNVVASRGIGDDLAEYLRAPIRTAPGLALYRMIQGEGVVHIADITDDDAYRSGNLGRRAIADLGGARSQLMVALRKDQTLLGAINIFRKEVRPFSDKQIALVENFAAQAVIAMENARLITEQREALERQTAIAEVLQVINASPGQLEPVFDAILTKSMRLCDAAFGIFNVYDGASFRTMVMRGVPGPFADFRAAHPPIPGPGTPFGRAFATMRPVHVVDWLEEPAYKAGTPGGRAIADLGGARTVLNVPLVKDATVLGMISFYRQQVRPFSETHIALLENFAAQAVIAMENARLLDAIRQRQEELRVTFENMGDGVAMFDEAPRLVAWNRKFQDILDLPGGLLAKRVTFVEYIRYLTERGEYGVGVEAEEQIRRLTENAGEYRAYERVRPDGRVIEVRHNPVAAGGFVLIFADITERKRTEAELRAARDAAEDASRNIEAAYRELKAAQANLIQAEKMASLGQLTAGIAHEIKNPLNFVNNFSLLSVELFAELKETIATALASPDAHLRAEVDEAIGTLTSNLEKITEHGQRADGIVRSMLEHSRGSSGERRAVDLNALVDEALSLAYHGARAQDQSFNITLERDFSDQLAPIELAPQDMTRVFLNLFSNGFYAANRRARNGGDREFAPTLKVTTRERGDAVEIRVRDNGTGIAADIREKLFQPFFTTKPTGEGTGLGLSISYDIVTQQHGGTISVNSEVGAWTEFMIGLPRQAFATT